MTDWPPRRRLLEELGRLDGRLAAGEPGADIRAARAGVLQALGRLDEAQAGYLEALAADPRHRGALVQFGALLQETGRRSAAITVYRRLIELWPGDAAAHANLGHVLWEHEDHAGAKASYERALDLDPGCVPAHQGLAAALGELRRDAEAGEHARLGYAARPILRLPYYGEREPLRVLVLASCGSGNVPITGLLDPRRVQATLVFAEFQEPDSPLPAHDVVFNAIGDADTGAGALAKAELLLRGTRAPVLNAPALVARTGRAANALRLRGLPGLVVPRTLDLGRSELLAPGLEDRLAAQGLAFPLLLRARGFHGGRHFEAVPDAASAAAASEGMPGDDFTLIERLEARGPDGKTRKYRVMALGGELYPLHAAVSTRWKVHYFSADMRDHPAHRAEDGAFLEDPASVLGPRALEALRRVAAELSLDYAGCDFSLGPDGEVLLFEANATMVIPRPEKGPLWDYRRPAVERLAAAFVTLLESRARAGASR